MSISGVHFDGLTSLKCSSLTAGAGNTHTAISFWAKVTRALGPPASNYLFAASNPGALPTLTLQSVAASTPCEAKQTWNASTQYSTIAPYYPTSSPADPDHYGGNDSQWMHFLIQLNSTTSRPGVVYVNGVYNGTTTSALVGANSTNGLNGRSFFLGGSGVGWPFANYLIGDLAEFWLASGVDLQELDGTFTPATLAKFIAPGNTPVFLGATGSTPTGAQPAIYLHRDSLEPASAFYANRGSGGTFTIFEGTLTSSAIDPPGPEPTPYAEWNTVGSATLGSTLTLTGLWSIAPSLLFYQWYNDLGAITGAHGPTYTITSGDVGLNVWCVITGLNDVGSTFVSTAHSSPSSTTAVPPTTTSNTISEVVSAVATVASASIPTVNRIVEVAALVDSVSESTDVPEVSGAPLPPETALVGSLFSVGDVIKVGCARLRVTAVNLDGTYGVHIIGDLSDFVIPDDPDGRVRIVEQSEWEWTTPSAVVTGLDHLEGKVVWALVDGVSEGPYTVVGGSITVSHPATNILVGLLYQQQVKTLYLTVDGLQPGTIQGKRKQITGTTLRVAKTLGLQSGDSFDALSPVKDTMPPSIDTDVVAVAAFSGDARNLAFPNWTETGEVCVQSDLPLPSSIQGIITEVTPGDTGR